MAAQDDPFFWPFNGEANDGKWTASEICTSMEEELRASPRWISYKELMSETSRLLEAEGKARPSFEISKNGFMMGTRESSEEELEFYQRVNQMFPLGWDTSYLHIGNGASPEETGLEDSHFQQHLHFPVLDNGLYISPKNNQLTKGLGVNEITSILDTIPDIKILVSMVGRLIDTMDDTALPIDERKRAAKVAFYIFGPLARACEMPLLIERVESRAMAVLDPVGYAWAKGNRREFIGEELPYSALEGKGSTDRVEEDHHLELLTLMIDKRLESLGVRSDICMAVVRDKGEFAEAAKVQAGRGRNDWIATAFVFDYESFSPDAVPEGCYSEDPQETRDNIIRLYLDTFGIKVLESYDAGVKLDDPDYQVANYVVEDPAIVSQKGELLSYELRFMSLEAYKKMYAIHPYYKYAIAFSRPAGVKPEVLRALGDWAGGLLYKSYGVVPVMNLQLEENWPAIAASISTLGRSYKISTGAGHATFHIPFPINTHRIPPEWEEYPQLWKITEIVGKEFIHSFGGCQLSYWEYDSSIKDYELNVVRVISDMTGLHWYKDHGNEGWQSMDPPVIPDYAKYDLLAVPSDLRSITAEGVARIQETVTTRRIMDSLVVYRDEGIEQALQLVKTRIPDMNEQIEGTVRRLLEEILPLLTNYNNSSRQEEGWERVNHKEGMRGLPASLRTGNAAAHSWLVRNFVDTVEFLRLTNELPILVSEYSSLLRELTATVMEEIDESEHLSWTSLARDHRVVAQLMNIEESAIMLAKGAVERGEVVSRGIGRRERVYAKGQSWIRVKTALESIKASLAPGSQAEGFKAAMKDESSEDLVEWLNLQNIEPRINSMPQYLHDTYRAYTGALLNGQTEQPLQFMTTICEAIDTLQDRARLVDMREKVDGMLLDMRFEDFADSLSVLKELLEESSTQEVGQYSEYDLILLLWEEDARNQEIVDQSVKRVGVRTEFFIKRRINELIAILEANDAGAIRGASQSIVPIQEDLFALMDAVIFSVIEEGERLPKGIEPQRSWIEDRWGFFQSIYWAKSELGRRNVDEVVSQIRRTFRIRDFPLRDSRHGDTFSYRTNAPGDHQRETALRIFPNLDADPNMIHLLLHPSRFHARRGRTTDFVRLYLYFLQVRENTEPVKHMRRWLREMYESDKDRAFVLSMGRPKAVNRKGKTQVEIERAEVEAKEEANIGIAVLAHALQGYDWKKQMQVFPQKKEVIPSSSLEEIKGFMGALDSGSDPVESVVSFVGKMNRVYRGGWKQYIGSLHDKALRGEHDVHWLHSKRKAHIYTKISQFIKSHYIRAMREANETGATVYWRPYAKPTVRVNPFGEQFDAFVLRNGRWENEATDEMREFSLGDLEFADLMDSILNHELVIERPKPH